MGDEVNFVDDMLTADGANELRHSVMAEEVYKFSVSVNTRITMAARCLANEVKIELPAGRRVKGMFFVRAADEFTHLLCKHFKSRGFKVKLSYERTDEGCVNYATISW